jgi:hypothetical protein
LQSDHFKTAQREFPRYLVATPRIIHVEVPQDNWSELGELTVKADS